MRKVLSLIITIVATMSVSAQVDCLPGQLSKQVDDTSITQLTITGQIDARDFKFIATQLHNLATVDLSNVEIVAYQDLVNSTLAGEHTFAAGTIPTMAFASKKMLTSVILPTTACAIGQAAFADCPLLSQVVMGEGLVTIGDYAFTACPALTTVEIPASVSTIGTGAFARCATLGEFKVSTTGTAAPLTIGDEAFIDCPALTTVEMPNVISIGNAAMAGTGLIVVDLKQYNNLRNVGDYAYVMSAATSATLPRSLTSMGKGMFMGSETLTSAILPASLDSLADYTFAGNTALTTIDLGNVASIGNYALYGTTALDNVIIPEGTTFVGTRAMAGMTALTQMESKAIATPTLGSDVWEGTPQSSINLAVPMSSVHSYRETAQWNEFNIGYYILKGDANEDLSISIADVNILINIMLGRTTSYPSNSDTDDDDSITIQDVNNVINVLLGRKQGSYLFVTSE